MKKILVCQHVAYEILGTLNPLFKAAGFRIRYVNFDRNPDAQPSLDGYSGLVILGGPMNVNDPGHAHLEYEVELIREAIRRGVAVLGICLGSQLIAKALGARVYRNPRKEIGWYPVSLTAEGLGDPVFSHFKPQETLFQWHGDTFELPPGTAHLASSADCAMQAFRHGKNVYGFQFHLEVDEPLIRRWLTVPRYRKELEELKGTVSAGAIEAGIPRHIERVGELSRKTFTEFIRLIGGRKAKKQLCYK